ncbi:3-deoxy-D-manno-octulosonate 8-phosphate phosphatase, YrbI family [Bacteriovorax sp. BSW11_IV]|nr:3-deoxy-D-manno-octulosonate 8-phosphate phosphatase, YrbI family [Bacteriovorax sp. BSW11_IV]
MQGNELYTVAMKFKDKLSKIKVCAFDIDGVLTNGLVWYDEGPNKFNRFFHTFDGYGLKVLMQAGLKVGVISGGQSLGVEKRFKENLGLDFAFLGNEDKREAYKKILEMGYKKEEILFMGDEFFDLPLLMASGFSATTNEASFEVKERVDYVANKPAGMGCVREVVDIVRYAKGIYPEVLDFENNPIPFGK